MFPEKPLWGGKQLCMYVCMYVCMYRYFTLSHRGKISKRYIEIWSVKVKVKSKHSSDKGMRENVLLKQIPGSRAFESCLAGQHLI